MTVLTKTDRWKEPCAEVAVLHPNLLKLAFGITKMEGYAPGTLAYRNNNPGNLRSSTIQSGKRDGFAFFSTFYHGLYALLWDLQCKCFGQTSTGLGPDSSLSELIHIYAPATENDPEAYHAFVTGSLGLAPDAPDPKLREFIHGK